MSNYIELRKKHKNVPGKIWDMVRKLKQLRQAGYNDDQIMDVLVKMNLPLSAHLYITGHFSDLISMV